MSDAMTAALAGLPAISVVYTDLDGTLLGPGGSLLTGPDGVPSARAANALVAAAAHGITVVATSGRALPQLRNDARLMGLQDCIAEAGAVILRNGKTRYEWGQCPRIAANPHDAMIEAGAVSTLLAEFADDLRLFEPWHRGREGGHLFHGSVDTAKADAVLAGAGCGWAHLKDNGATGGWEGRSVRAYHLLPRGVGKAPAVADDLAARGLDPSCAAAVGDSLEDLTMAAHVGVYFLVANGHGETGARVVRTPGAMGHGFADAIAALLRVRGVNVDL